MDNDERKPCHCTYQLAPPALVVDALQGPLTWHIEPIVLASTMLEDERCKPALDARMAEAGWVPVLVGQQSGVHPLPLPPEVPAAAHPRLAPSPEDATTGLHQSPKATARSASTDAAAPKNPRARPKSASKAKASKESSPTPTGKRPPRRR